VGLLVGVDEGGELAVTAGASLRGVAGALAGCGFVVAWGTLVVVPFVVAETVVAGAGAGAETTGATVDDTDAEELSGAAVLAAPAVLAVLAVLAALAALPVPAALSLPAAVLAPLGVP
jgi:hypothetical protein